MSTKIDSPFYLRLSMNLISLSIIAAIIYLGRSILTPIFLSGLLAMLLHPFVSFLTKRKINRVLAITICIVLSVCVIAIIVYFLSTQIGHFLDDIPAMKERLREVSMSAKRWVQENFNIGIREQNKYLNETTEKMNEGQGIVQQTVLTLTELISYLIFLPVYAFLILYHKNTIKTFLVTIFKRSEEDKIAEVLDESQHISQQYVMGVLIELGIVFTLNAAGFLLIGIKYAIFLALVAALLNIVPYIGMIIANVFCVLITLVSADPNFNVLWVAAVLAGVQIVDNNVLMPYIVGSKIRINAMAIILGVLVGGALCGVPGMFLALPGLAIMKVVFERVDNLKAWAILMGDEVTENRGFKNPLRRAFSRAGRKTKDNPA